MRLAHKTKTFTFISSIKKNNAAVYLGDFFILSLSKCTTKTFLFSATYPYRWNAPAIQIDTRLGRPAISSSVCLCFHGQRNLEIV